jgi:hypothetical protein
MALASESVVRNNVAAIVVAVVTIDFVVATLANMFAQWLMEQRGQAD